MTYGVYALRDRVSENFSSPTFEEKNDVAMRNLAFSVNNTSQMLFFSKDLELWKIGDIELKTGVITPLVPMQLVCRADSLIGKDAADEKI